MVWLIRSTTILAILLASGGSDNLVRLWNIETGKVTATLRGHTNIVFAIAFSPDGARLASGSTDKSIMLWKIPNSEGKEEK